jgi:hypothetical protein
MTMKKATLLDVTICGSCMNRRFGGTYRFRHQDEKNWRDSNNVGSLYSQRASIASYSYSYHLDDRGHTFLQSVGCRFLQRPHGVTS